MELYKLSHLYNCEWFEWFDWFMIGLTKDILLNIKKYLFLYYSRLQYCLLCMDIICNVNDILRFWILYNVNDTVIKCALFWSQISHMILRYLFLHSTINDASYFVNQRYLSNMK